MTAAEATPFVNAEGKWQILNWQPLDDTGKPVGNPTTSPIFDTPQELMTWQQNQVLNLIRGYHRLKNAQQVVRPNPPAVPARKELTPQEERDAGMEIAGMKPDGSPRKAIRTLVPELDEISTLKEQMDRQTAIANVNIVVYRFVRDHINDYYDCQANTNLMDGYLKTHNLPFTVESLEIAFAAVQDQLAQSPEVVPPVNPVVEPLRASTGGIQPGSFNATGEGGAKPTGLTKEDVKKHITDKSYKRRIRDPKYAAAVNELFGKK